MITILNAPDADGLKEMYPSRKRVVLKNPQSNTAPAIVPRLLPLPPRMTIIQA
jgi:hypothetical protein